jgi:membrane fusion protein, multidrug efflux system
MLNQGGETSSDSGVADLRPASAARAADNEAHEEKQDRKDEQGGQQQGGQPAGQQPQDTDQKQDGQQQAGQPKPRSKWPFIVAGTVMAIFVGVVLWMIFRPRADVWTDDAYVMVHYASIAPRISGQVTDVPVDDNQLVKAGQLLVALDPRDYETAVASAEAIVAKDAAQLAEATNNVMRQPAIIEQQAANVAAARARLTIAEPDAQRFKNLAATGAGTLQQRQQADSTLEQSQAQLDNSIAALEAARRQLDILQAQRDAAKATLDTDTARLEQARLNLSYTKIPAPVDGVVSERSVQVGNVVAPGAIFMTVVPLDQVYIIANYREVDLIHVLPGQPVTIHVDAYNIDLSGTVQGLAPATGASYAPIQPNNATGNFTKIVQRLPLKIVVDPRQPLAKLLRVGFSVETTVHTGLENVVNEQGGSSSRVTGH